MSCDDYDDAAWEESFEKMEITRNTSPLKKSRDKVPDWSHVDL
jgi:predicted DNA-binding protein (UPF0251 family)